MTPWGNAGELRDRKLPPGRSHNREEVERNQRERLFAATVAVTAEKGYDRTSVADLIELSGVSRSAFYEHFDDKLDCFEATVDASVDASLAIVSHVRSGGSRGGGVEARARAALEMFVRLIVLQPAAAHVCFVEAHAAGPTAIASVERAITGFEELIRQVFEELPGREEMPPGLIRGMVGALQKVIHTRVYRGQAADLEALAPRLLEWGLGYVPPPEPLRRARRTQVAPADARPFVAQDPAERIIRAVAAVVAEQGVAGAKVSEMAERASISQATFYAHFEGKDEALLAAIDSSGAQMVAAVLPAIRRERDWPSAVRTVQSTVCRFLAAEPDFARLRSIEAYAAGPRALEVRDRAAEEIAAGLLSSGLAETPEVDPIVLEAIGGAIHFLVSDQVRAKGPQNLPDIVPLATYITLAPFIGAAQACAVANGDRPR